MTIDFFYEKLLKFDGVTEFDKALFDALCSLDKNLTCDVKIVLMIFLSLLNDGNIFISLDSENDNSKNDSSKKNVLEKKWQKKWNALLVQKENFSDNLINDFYKNEFFNDTKKSIKNGICQILNFQKNNFCIFSLIDEVENNSNAFSEKIKNSKMPFIISVNKNCEKKLYSKKHFVSKCKIENALKKFFNNQSAQKISEEEIQNTILNAKKIVSDFQINSEQAQAVLRGQTENLIITGGPGTGKTTVILFLLWFLLQNNFDKIENIFMAAPSGKAADRMSESLKKNLSYITDSAKIQNPKIFERINNICDSSNGNSGGQTLHRLLSYDPIKNTFKYNSKNQFPKKSLFVIDEASMIDVTLFASFLEALPSDARLFILGDPFQLPSVEAGAVLESILKLKKDSTVKLITSRRFDDDSKIGNLAKKINLIAESIINSEDENNLNENQIAKDFFDDLKNNFENSINENLNLIDDSKINFICVDSENNKNLYLEKNNIENILNIWTDYFLENLFSLAEKINPEEKNLNESARNEQKKYCDELWNLSLQYRILSAEHNGKRGVDFINNFICEKMKSQKYCREFENEKYFPGQLLIITQNQKMFNLWNGDTGIVVFSKPKNNKNDFENSRAENKIQLEENSIQEKNILSELRRPFVIFKKADGYEFFPLSSLPTESIENAFAITIHKSQGSEYDHILMFLPKQKGHPLSSNQIVYTGLTRAKKSASIVSSPESFECACKTLLTRDTGLEL